jgi:hypothetical protein
MDNSGNRSCNGTAGDVRVAGQDPISKFTTRSFSAKAAAIWKRT